MKPKTISSKDWFPKVVAAVTLGLLFALGISGLVLEVCFGEAGMYSSRGQFLMWIISPIWTTVLCLCFLFRSGLSAWLWLGGMNLAVWALFYILRF